MAAPVWMIRQCPQARPAAPQGIPGTAAVPEGEAQAAAPMEVEIPVEPVIIMEIVMKMITR